MSKPEKMGSSEAPKEQQSPLESTDKPPKSPSKGVLIDADTKPEEKEKKEELTDEEKVKCGKFRFEAAKKLANASFDGLSVAQIETKMENIVGKLPPEIVKYVKGNFKHLYTVDNGKYLIEVNMEWKSEDVAGLKIDCYDKNSFTADGENPDNKSDVPKLKPWLEFKSEGIQLMKGVTTEKELREKLKRKSDKSGLLDLVDKKGLTEALGGEKPAQYSTNHLISFDVGGGKVIELNIRCKEGQDAMAFLIIRTASGTTYEEFQDGE